MLGYVEVYAGTDQAVFWKMRDALREGGIPYREKQVSGRDRLATDVVLGAPPLVAGARGNEGVHYRLLVKKAQEEEALYLLQTVK